MAQTTYADTGSSDATCKAPFTTTTAPANGCRRATCGTGLGHRLLRSRGRLRSYRCPRRLRFGGWRQCRPTARVSRKRARSQAAFYDGNRSLFSAETDAQLRALPLGQFEEDLAKPGGCRSAAPRRRSSPVSLTAWVLGAAASSAAAMTASVMGIDRAESAEDQRVFPPTHLIHVTRHWDIFNTPPAASP